MMPKGGGYLREKTYDEVDQDVADVDNVQET